MSKILIGKIAISLTIASTVELNLGAMPARRVPERMVHPVLRFVMMPYLLSP